MVELQKLISEKQELEDRIDSTKKEIIDGGKQLKEYDDFFDENYYHLTQVVSANINYLNHYQNELQELESSIENTKGGIKSMEEFFIEQMPLPLFKEITEFEAVDGGFYVYNPDGGIDSPANRISYLEYLLTKKDFIKKWKENN